MEKIYAKGLFVKRNEKAPDFVLCNLSIKTDDFIPFLNKNTNEKGYVNLQVLKGKNKGTFYANIDNFTPKTDNVSTETKKSVKTKNNDPFQNGNSDGDLPF